MIKITIPINITELSQLSFFYESAIVDLSLSFNIIVHANLHILIDKA